MLETAARAKLVQAEAYGARVIRVREFGVTESGTNSVVERLKARARTSEAVLLISATCISPRQMAGVKTISFEVCEQLGCAPDHVFGPIGGGGLFYQCYQGYLEWFQEGRIERVPRIARGPAPGVRHRGGAAEPETRPAPRPLPAPAGFPGCRWPPCWTPRWPWTRCWPAGARAR